MLLLANENIPLSAVVALRTYGHDVLSRGVRRHSEKTPSSEASADREGMKAEPRTVVL